jgi:hypothetical protein
VHVLLFKTIFFKQNHHLILEKTINLQEQKQELSSFKNNNKDLQPSKTKIKNFQPSKTKIRTFNPQKHKQEPSTSKFFKLKKTL